MKPRPLWAISITIAREAEEAVVALLERLFGQTASAYSEDESPVSVATVYTSHAASRVLSKRPALEAGLGFLASCGLELGPATIEIKPVPPEDWSESWKKYFKPIEIGSALLVKPSWDKQRPAKGTAIVTLDPGLSFGTGQHPTTGFCLEQLVAARQLKKTQAFLDIGTGSGILAIAAVKLGYAPVRAFDFDPTAVRTAKANARKNRIEHKLRIIRQDLAKLRPESPDRYEVICANLTDDLLVRYARVIIRRLDANGTLILAGILATQFPAVRTVYEGLGYRLETTRTEGGWQSGTFQRGEVAGKAP